jgi:TfoX/Sxy family transcriptional regulator of competence genes
MAKEYFEKLSTLINELKITEEASSSMEVKHFFSGAALYVNKTICVSWSPVGLAFKLPEKEAESLIEDGKAKPLKYFAKGHIKQGYALFENTSIEPSEWKSLFIKAVRQV